MFGRYSVSVWDNEAAENKFYYFGGDRREEERKHIIETIGDLLNGTEERKG